MFTTLPESYRSWNILLPICQWIRSSTIFTLILGFLAWMRQFLMSLYIKVSVWFVRTVWAGKYCRRCRSFSILSSLFRRTVRAFWLILRNRNKKENINNKLHCEFRFYYHEAHSYSLLSFYEINKKLKLEIWILNYKYKSILGFYFFFFYLDRNTMKIYSTSTFG